MASGLTKTYTTAQGPSHISLDEYFEACNRDYRALLEANPPEADMQSFFEEHPCVVPGHSTPTGVTGHPPLHYSLVTQPRLPVLPSRTPDFMWIASHSGAWFPTLIEIESPQKRIYQQAGVPRREFTEARNQLNQWRGWFSQPENVPVLKEFLGVRPPLSGRPMHLHMLLIYGRRAETEGTPQMAMERDGLLPGSDEDLMSFDRLSADTSMADAITVKATGGGKYEAVWIPPVFGLGPGPLAERLLYVEGIPEAIDKNPDIASERKTFLKDRIPYWEEWARNGSRGIFNPADRE